MPGYPYLARTELDYRDIAERLRTLREVGVPYTDEMIENAKADLERQLDPAAEGVKEFLQRYPKAQVRQFDGDPSQCPSSTPSSPICRCSARSSTSPSSTRPGRI